MTRGFLSGERKGVQLLRGYDTACRPLVTTYTELDYDHLVFIIKTACVGLARKHFA
jgi:hypothetical protein